VKKLAVTKVQSVILSFCTLLREISRGKRARLQWSSLCLSSLVYVPTVEKRGRRPPKALLIKRLWKGEK
jgi:hypothetical protein